MTKKEKLIKDRVKQIRVETDPLVISTSELEAHHCNEQAHNGGRISLDNMFGELPHEHAFSHYIEAEVTIDPLEKKKNYWSVSAILRRCNHEQTVEYIEMVNTRRKRQSRRSN